MNCWREHRGCPSHDIKIAVGDFNAKRGQEQDVGPIIGKESLQGESNTSGVKTY
jgi:hypothetical protein